MKTLKFFATDCFEAASLTKTTGLSLRNSNFVLKSGKTSLLLVASGQCCTTPSSSIEPTDSFFLRPGIARPRLCQNLLIAVTEGAKNTTKLFQTLSHHASGMQRSKHAQGRQRAAITRQIAHCGPLSDVIEKARPPTKTIIIWPPIIIALIPRKK